MCSAVSISLNLRMNTCSRPKETTFASCMVMVLAPVRTSDVTNPTTSLTSEMRSMPKCR